MKRGIEYRPNGNRIIKRNVFGYDVHILRQDGGFRLSENGPWDYLRSARNDADRHTPLHIIVKLLGNNIPVKEDISDEIRNVTAATNVLTHNLRETYLPMMKECETRKELSNLVSNIKMSLGMECGQGFPGTFGVDIIFEFQRFYEGE